ncbi:class I SAM-dependent methyltransferase [Staphylococcus aureus]
MSFEQHKVWRKRVMKDMGVKGTKALDVCCGTGDWTIALSRSCRTNGCLYWY